MSSLIDALRRSLRYPSVLARGVDMDRPTVIDADEFEAAHDDPQWAQFCRDADEYLETVEREQTARASKPAQPS